MRARAWRRRVVAGLLATLEPDQFPSTRELSVRFERPAKPGTIRGVGKVVERSGDMAHLSATLYDESGATLAAATAVTTVIPLSEASSAP